MRRGDAKLFFPERVVQLHKVDPSAEELELIRVLAKPIQKLNRLAQISILFALTSSPHALMAQLNTMARNGTVPQDLAVAVRSMPCRAALRAYSPEPAGRVVQIPNGGLLATNANTLKPWMSYRIVA